MDRNTLLGAGALIVIVLGILLYATFAPIPAKAPAPETPAFTLPDLHYGEKAPEYEIETNYASSTPLAEPANTAAISLMKSFIASTITQFKTSGTFGETASSTLNIVYLIGSSIHSVSYIYTIDTYQFGASHGNEVFKTFTFDTTTGAPLALSDLFLPGADYLDTLSQLARARLPEVIGSGFDMSAINDGTAPVADNFQNFFLDNTDFVLLFPAYQVAAYSEGPQTLRIPLSLLSRILKPEYR